MAKDRLGTGRKTWAGRDCRGGPAGQLRDFLLPKCRARLSFGRSVADRPVARSLPETMSIRRNRGWSGIRRGAAMRCRSIVSAAFYWFEAVSSQSSVMRPSLVPRWRACQEPRRLIRRLVILSNNALARPRHEALLVTWFGHEQPAQPAVRLGRSCTEPFGFLSALLVWPPDSRLRTSKITLSSPTSPAATPSLLWM